MKANVRYTKNDERGNVRHVNKTKEIMSAYAVFNEGIMSGYRIVLFD